MIKKNLTMLPAAFRTVDSHLGHPGYPIFDDVSAAFSRDEEINPGKSDENTSGADTITGTADLAEGTVIP